MCFSENCALAPAPCTFSLVATFFLEIVLSPQRRAHFRASASSPGFLPRLLQAPPQASPQGPPQAFPHAPVQAPPKLFPRLLRRLLPRLSSLLPRLLLKLLSRLLPRLLPWPPPVPRFPSQLRHAGLSSQWISCLSCLCSVMLALVRSCNIALSTTEHA